MSERLLEEINEMILDALVLPQNSKEEVRELAKGIRAKTLKAVGEWFENNWHPYWTYTRAEDIIVALKSGKLPEGE